MADSQVLVVLLRRDEDTLSTSERSAIEQAFTGKQVRFQRTDPRDYKEHAEQCRELQPAAVVLPLERPIPSVAMEEGFQHIVVTPAGLQELLPLKAEFKPFEPKA
jgi:hypothetical protein